jgi:hypothetical protein
VLVSGLYFDRLKRFSPSHRLAVLIIGILWMKAMLSVSLGKRRGKKIIGYIVVVCYRCTGGMAEVGEELFCKCVE